MKRSTPTSATGISTSRVCARRARGFTLVEILVVVVIIGIMAVGAMLSLSSVGEDRGLQNETDRLYALMNYAREQAELQTREYGVRAFEGGYEFVAYDARTRQWLRLQNDDALRTRTLPGGVDLSVRVEGRQVVLPKKPDPKVKKVEDLTPQAMLFSSGELNGFEIGLVRASTHKGTSIVAHEEDDRIEATGVQDVKR